MKIITAAKNPRLWPWGLGLVGLILRLWDLGASPLWYDEAYTRLLVNRPLGQALEAIAGDVHPPLYYLILWGWVRLLGDSVVALRLLSVVFSMLALWVAWRLSARLGLSQRGRLLALGLLAIQPTLIYYAQEVRMYSLLLLLVELQLFFLVTENYKFLALVTVEILYTHNYGLFYTGAIFAAGLAIQLQKKPGARLDGCINLSLALAAAAAAWGPWAGLMIGQALAIHGHYWIRPLSLGSALEAVYAILGALNAPDWAQPVSVSFLAAGLLLVALEGLRAKKITLVLCSFGPLALALIASFISPVLLFRGLIGILPMLALLVGLLASTTSRRGRWVAGALCLPMLAALGWQIGANHIGRVKSSPALILPSDRLPVIHLNDITLVLSQDQARNKLLLAGCPAEAGALSAVTRQALGFQTIPAAELPAHYYLSAFLGPLSNQCEEEQLRQLSSSASSVWRVNTQFYTFGVWQK